MTGIGSVAYTKEIIRNILPMLYEYDSTLFDGNVEELTDSQ